MNRKTKEANRQKSYQVPWFCNQIVLILASVLLVSVVSELYSDLDPLSVRTRTKLLFNEWIDRTRTLIAKPPPVVPKDQQVPIIMVNLRQEFVDEANISWPPPLCVHADILQRLLDRKPRAIFVDFVFPYIRLIDLVKASDTGLSCLDEMETAFRRAESLEVLVIIGERAGRELRRSSRGAPAPGPEGASSQVLATPMLANFTNSRFVKTAFINSNTESVTIYQLHQIKLAGPTLAPASLLFNHLYCGQHRHAKIDQLCRELRGGIEDYPLRLWADPLDLQDQGLQPLEERTLSRRALELGLVMCRYFNRDIQDWIDNFIDFYDKNFGNRQDDDLPLRCQVPLAGPDLQHAIVISCGGMQAYYGQDTIVRSHLAPCVQIKMPGFEGHPADPTTQPVFIVGADYERIDEHDTAVYGNISGSQIHAMVLQNLAHLGSDYIGSKNWNIYWIKQAYERQFEVAFLLSLLFYLAYRKLWPILWWLQDRIIGKCKDGRALLSGIDFFSKKRVQGSALLIYFCIVYFLFVHWPGVELPNLFFSSLSFPVFFSVIVVGLRWVQPRLSRNNVDA
ncbi:MAG: CHASE2 domain-containing protein [Alphaproteobacteria bacterium]|nr:CHASE2 domain-containing protein [Alphaproteobacteria bacterium]